MIQDYFETIKKLVQEGSKNLENRTYLIGKTNHYKEIPGIKELVQEGSKYLKNKTFEPKNQ